MSEKEFQKFLNRPEARHRYWHIHKADRDFFPPAHEIFKLEFHDREYELKVNHKDDIMTGKLFEHYRFFEGDSITVKKKKYGVYQLISKDARKW